MMIDNLKNAPYYYDCHSKIELILRYLESVKNLPKLPPDPRRCLGNWLRREFP